MGTVCMAQQPEPVKRLVAVKLIKAGMDTNKLTKLMHGTSLRRVPTGESKQRKCAASTSTTTTSSTKRNSPLG